MPNPADGVPFGSKPPPVVPDAEDGPRPIACPRARPSALQINLDPLGASVLDYVVERLLGDAVQSNLDFVGQRTLP